MEGRGGKRARSAVGERAADPRRESVVAPMAVLSPAATIGFQTARVGTMTNYGSRVRVLVAGAGVAGLETALALRALAPEFVSVELVAPETEFTYRPLAVTEPFRVGPVSWDEGVLHLSGDRRIEADAVVALAKLEGPAIAGLPRGGAGFVPTGEFGRVLGLTDVYAAGDLTQFPVKQGGIAAQQADAVASAIAADAGATVKPTAFRPVLRGLLLTGLAPRFLRSEPGTARSLVETEPLWWPPAKIVGRYLTPFLAEHLGLSQEYPRPERTDAVPVEVELDTREQAWSAV